MIEFELKLEVSPANLKGVAIDVLAGKASRQRLQASYFDTPDGALAACGIVVRLRKEGRRWVQTAKGPASSMLERLEHNITLPAQRAGLAPALDLSRHRSTPVGKLIDKALRLKPHQNYPTLELLYGTDVQRITRRVACGKSIVEVALDQGRVFTTAKSQPICELEFELKEGSPHDVVELARQWYQAHGLWLSTIAKSMKGQRLRAGALCGPAALATQTSFSRRVSRNDLITAVVTACLAQILPNMSELASGSNDADHIHQLRVGIRRLRTALQELAELSDAISPTWEPALAQAFRLLGAHRDHSYLALVIQPQLLAAGGPDMHFDDTDHHVPDAGTTVRAAEFQGVLFGLLGFVHRAVTQSGEANVNVEKTVSRRLAKLHSRALGDGKNFLLLDEEQQHSVRKRFKRLRYLTELTAPLFKASKVKVMTAALKPVQEALGLYNDELMGLQALQAVAENQPNAWFGIGWLTARRERNAKRCLKSINAVAGVEPFWHH